MEFFLSSDEIALLQAKLASVPDADTCVYFDIHTSNIMIRHGEFIIIDMGYLSHGSYLFDIGLLYTIEGFPELGTCEMVTKIPNDTGRALWLSFETQYFANKSADEYAFFDKNRGFFASLRLIYSITFLPKQRDQLAIMNKDVLLPKIL